MFLVTKEGEKKKQRHEISFIPDVIVKVSSEKPMIRNTLKVSASWGPRSPGILVG